MWFAFAQSRPNQEPRLIGTSLQWPDMKNTVLGAPPEFTQDVESALEELGKHGYTATVRDAGSSRFITFTFGESEQTLEFKKDDWRKPGVVQKAIVEHLNI